MGADLVDTGGVKIWSNGDYWYKIMLADGTELGLGKSDDAYHNGRTRVQVVPAGRGMVFRYQRQDGSNRENQGWPQGDKGWLRGLQVKDDGTHVVKNMSLSNHGVSTLCMYDDNTNYGFVAEQLAGNRAALYGYKSGGKLVGLRVISTGEVIADANSFFAPLDVSFVRTGTRSTGFF